MNANGASWEDVARAATVQRDDLRQTLGRTERERDELLDTINAITDALGIENAQHVIEVIETLKKERDEARDGKLREIRHDWSAMLEDRAQAWRERDEAREELAGLRAEVDALTESLRACVAERDGWQRTARQRSEEIETLEEKLHADTVTRIAVTRAWREAVAEVAEVLARTAAEKGGRP